MVKKRRTKKKVCMYCGSSRKIVLEHIIARSKGGVKTVPACEACNSSKGTKALMEWLRWIKSNNPYRWRRIRNYNKGKSSDIARKVQKIVDNCKISQIAGFCPFAGTLTIELRKVDRVQPSSDLFLERVILLGSCLIEQSGRLFTYQTRLPLPCRERVVSARGGRPKEFQSSLRG
ncbi:MAG: hypothetical protein DDT32_01043 [Syntrophomonadaceae bacterium]|nr:hypothetical protein [Bacillota bacterium]